MNTYEKLILNDNKEIKLTLNFARLLKVKNDYKDTYEKYNRFSPGVCRRRCRIL